MRSRRLIGVAVVCLFLTAGSASAAVGNLKLAHYFVPDPIGGSPVADADLRALVALEHRALVTFDPGVVVAAQGWNNTKTHARFIEVALALSRTVQEPGANARETVTSACGTAGGAVGAFHSIAGVPNGYEAACRSLVRPKEKPFEVVAFVKKNVFVIFISSTAAAFSLPALDSAAVRQYGLVPGSGVPAAMVA